MKILSVKDILVSANKFILFITFCFCLLTILSFSAIFFQSHSIICEMFELKMEDSSYAISRELALGEFAVSEQLFSSLKSSISKMAYSTAIELKVSPGLTGQSCSPGVFSSQINYQLKFSGKPVGTIVGKIQVYGSSLFCLYMLFLIVALFLIVYSLRRSLFHKINVQLIDPVLRLCELQEIDKDVVSDEVLRISSNLDKMKQAVALNEKAKLEIQHARRLSSIVKQLNHDIASPVMALDTIVSSQAMKSLDENLRAMTNFSLIRIREILKDLNEKYENDGDTCLRMEFIPGLLSSIIQEKKAEYLRHEKEIDLVLNLKTMEGAFSNINKTSFERSVSNLLNNAIESILDKGNVNLSVDVLNDKIEVVIADNGSGIPAGILSKLVINGFSYNKKNGSGLGLQYARNFVEKIGGAFSISSTEGIGTTIRITMPRSSSGWFKSPDFTEVRKIIILDNDFGVHQIWREKFKNTNLQIEHYYSTSELSKIVTSFTDGCIFFCDYDLGSSEMTGFDIIRKLVAKNDIFLVTNNYNDEVLIEKSVEYNIPIIPKNVIEFINV